MIPSFFVFKIIIFYILYKKPIKTMIYIDKNNKIGKFPKISNDSFSRIKFVNQVSNQEIVFNTSQTGKNIVYTIDLEPIIDQFVEGQYDYYFENNNGDVINSGILQFGDFEPELIEYNTEKNTIQYN
jgi:hypothetical protein